MNQREEKLSSRSGAARRGTSQLQSTLSVLNGSGKSQDGLVSRFINRRISRAITRVLLRTPITPTSWTLAICILPMVGAAFLSRGDYRSVVVGLLFFELYSILDGCDGEIARAKSLESRRGQQLDQWCDIFGSLLLALGLGYGLSLRATAGSFFLIEGIGVAALIATNELILALPSRAAEQPTGADGALYPRHRQMIERSGLLVLAPRFTSWLIQLTKRDVAILAFLLLGLIGQPAWILHLSGAVAAGSALLALRSRIC